MDFLKRQGIKLSEVHIGFNWMDTNIWDILRPSNYFSIDTDSSNLANNKSDSLWILQPGNFNFSTLRFFISEM